MENPNIEFFSQLTLNATIQIIDKIIFLVFIFKFPSHRLLTNLKLIRIELKPIKFILEILLYWNSCRISWTFQNLNNIRKSFVKFEYTNVPSNFMIVSLILWIFWVFLCLQGQWTFKVLGIEHAVFTHLNGRNSNPKCVKFQ